jgi:dnd system-associated protein 4
MTNRFGTEDLVDLIAVAETDDPDVLDPQRLPERIRIFEAYANGGLEVFQETISREGLTAAEALHRLVQQSALPREDPLGDDAPDVSDLGRALGL